MTPEQMKALEEDLQFKAIRHKVYRFGKRAPELLIEMGVIHPGAAEVPFSKEEMRIALFDLAGQGRLPELEALITRTEAEKEEQKNQDRF